LIVVDDCNPYENARKLVHSFHSPHIRYHLNPKNLGLAGNWNRCLELANTELVNILHSDDELKKNYAREVLEYAQKYPKVAAFYTDVDIINANGKKIFSFPDFIKKLIRPSNKNVSMIAGDQGLSQILKGNFIFCPSLTYRKALIKNLNF